MRKLTTSDFIQKSIQVHGERYEYCKTNYQGSKKKLIITCREHGDFQQLPNNHYAGKGCPKCGKLICSQSIKDTTEEFIRKAQVVHTGTYGYANTIYTGDSENVEITCSTHGNFWQLATHHKAGSGCPKCANISNRKAYYDEPTILYYIKFNTDEGPLYKIGITMERIGIQDRFRKDKVPYEVIRSWKFTSGKGAYSMEQMILANHSEHSYKGSKILQGGNSELFTKDILNLGKEFTNSLKV